MKQQCFEWFIVFFHLNKTSLMIFNKGIHFTMKFNTLSMHLLHKQMVFFDENLSIMCYHFMATLIITHHGPITANMTFHIMACHCYTL